MHVRRRLGPAFPYGTLVINVTGSFVLGLLAGLAEHHGVRPGVVTVVGTGLLGAYTTYSTFTFDTVGLAERGRTGRGGGQRRRPAWCSGWRPPRWDWPPAIAL